VWSAAVWGSSRWWWRSQKPTRCLASYTGHPAGLVLNAVLYCSVSWAISEVLLSRLHRFHMDRVRTVRWQIWTSFCSPWFPAACRSAGHENPSPS
jgi:hypothetical protein